MMCYWQYMKYVCTLRVYEVTHVLLAVHEVRVYSESQVMCMNGC